WRRPNAARQLPVLALAIMSLRVARLVPLYAEAAVCFCGSLWLTGREPALTRGRRAFEAVGVLIVPIAMLPRENGILWLPLSGNPWVPDQEIPRALKDQAAAGRLVLPYSWGHYAIWHLGPRLRVSIDGRRETIYSDRVLAEQDAVMPAEPSGTSFIE